MAPFVEREWGAKATEMMWRIKRLADPDGVLGPGVVLNRDPGVHLREPEDDAGDRGGGDDLRRVRVLRAGLPEPQPDDDAAPADRPAPRDGPPARRARRCCEALLERLRVRRAPDLRRRRHLPIACPVGIDTGKLVKEPARRRARPSARSASRCGRRSAGPTSSAPRGRPAGRRARSPGVGDGPLRREPRRRGARVSAELVPEWGRRDAAAGAADAAGDEPRRRRRRLPAGVRQPDLRPRPRGRRSDTARPARGAGRGLAPGRHAGLDPDRRRRPLLRDPVELEGLPRRRRAGWRTATVEALWRWSDDGRAAGRDRRELLHATASLESGGAAQRRERGAPRDARVLDSIAWAHEHLLPELESGSRSARPPSIRPARRATSASTAALERLAGGACRGGRRPRRGDLLRLRRRPRLPAPRADAHRRPPPRPAEVAAGDVRRPPLRNRTCEIGLSGRPGEPTSRSSTCSSG